MEFNSASECVEKAGVEDWLSKEGLSNRQEFRINSSGYPAATQSADVQPHLSLYAIESERGYPDNIIRMRALGWEKVADRQAEGTFLPCVI